MAGKNKKEIRRVLDHYEGDSLKYLAARYLIIDMVQNKSLSYQNEQYEKFTSKVYDSVAKLEIDIFSSKNDTINKMLRARMFEDIWTHYSTEFDPPNLHRFSYIPDIRNIKADFLIENIDYAFKAWELPWSKEYNFDEFCQFILPYRYADESLTSWRKSYWDKFGYVIDSLKTETDPVQVAIFINEQLKKDFWGSEMLKGFSRGGIKPLNLLKSNIPGNCEDQTGIGYSAMRAFGIATSEVIVPNWGNRGKMGHTFSVVLDPKENQWIDFHAGDINPLSNETTNMPKAFLLDAIPTGSDENFLKFYENLTDLTSEFTTTVDIQVAVGHLGKIPKFAYLCIFDGEKWDPIASKRIENKEITFREVGVNKVYLPVLLEGKEIIPLSSPILVDSLKNITSLEPDTSHFFLATLLRKFTLNKHTVENRSHDLKGGKFQVASKSDFSDAKTIYTVPEFASYIPIQIDVPESAGNYVRFVFPNVEKVTKDGPSWLAFYQEKNGFHHILKGDYISSEKISRKNMDAIFDEDLLSYVSLVPTDIDLPQDFWNHIPFRGSTDSLWVGMRLEETATISKIGYCPRNDKNNIYPGLEYELFYWDKKWNSLGKKIATDYELTFDSIPSKSLLLLKCHSEGKEERIFTLDNEGQQVWW